MTRRGLAWILALPLAVVGSQLAHGLAYRLVIGDQDLARELSASGHGYLAYAPVALAVCVALVAFALVRELQLAVLARRPSHTRPSALSFAVLAPAIFVAQEYLERLVHEGGFPLDFVLEGTFAVGLVLQLPFALAAYVVARLLLRATRAVAQLLSPPPAALAECGSGWNLAGGVPVRSRAGGPALGARGPPLLAV